MRILLDADMLLFRVAAATEVEVQLADDVWTRHSDLGPAREMYWDQLKLWCDIYGCTFDDVWHCFTDRSAFRRDLFPGYKASRKATPKPIGFKQLKAELMTEQTAFMFNQIEADDLIGIFATMPSVGDDVVIASGDKDLLQVAGVHVWMDTGKEQQDEDGLSISYANGSIIKTNTVEHAERFTYRQCLSGDSTDGIPGCKGVGDVGAKRIADKLDPSKPVDCWEAVVRTYEEAWRKAKLDVRDAPDFATQQARLVRVLRSGEYNFSSHTVTLWNPPTH